FPLLGPCPGRRGLPGPGLSRAAGISVKAVQSTPRAAARASTFDQGGSLTPCSHFSSVLVGTPAFRASWTRLSPASRRSSCSRPANAGRFTTALPSTDKLGKLPKIGLTHIPEFG